MEYNKKRRLRRVSSWTSEAALAVNNEEDTLIGKKIVLKMLRYMESNHMTQKQLAEKLGVSPQHINKFLHGQECDIKVSTAIRYGKILGIRLIEVPEETDNKHVAPTVVYACKSMKVNRCVQVPFAYNRMCNRGSKERYIYN